MAGTGIIDEMRHGYARATMLMKIIWINIAVFVLLRVTAIVCMFAGNADFINVVMRWVQLPSDLPTLGTRPWTLLTYMFSQYDILHILFNMLWFYWFGTLFRMVSTPKQMLALYIFGGLGGALLFLAAYNLLPLFAHSTGWLIGSSASVIAIVTATAILMPDFRMNLLFIGSVSLKWIAIATIVLVLIGVTGDNAGGEIAHIGGVLVGAWYGVRMKRGHDITAPLNRFFDLCVNAWDAVMESLKRGRNTASDSSKSAPAVDKDDRETLDEILDKIKKSGYAALTPEERKKLFDVSRRMK